jgi:transketolase
MRRALAETLTELVTEGRPVHVLTADTGFHVFDDFQKRFPDRYLNVGVAESAMVALAAGLARAGRRVFTYGIVPFVTMRCFEQIRLDLCYPLEAGLPVTIVGVGGGLTYGPAGTTHHAIEDIAVMRALPNMTVVCPGDGAEVRAAVRASLDLAGPCYLRLGKTGEPAVHAGEIEGFAIGRGVRLQTGGDVALIATGNMLPVAAEACDLLAGRGVEATLVSMHTVKPIDRALVAELAGGCRMIATVEEHSIVGGLGEAVAGVLADSPVPAGRAAARLRRFALPDAYAHEAGSQAYFRRRHGLTAEQIADAIHP